MRVPVQAFNAPPATGDTLLVGLTEATPRCAVRLQFRCTINGVGVDPNDPPLRWEAWCGQSWEPCEVGEDSTGGLNRDGTIVLHLPAGHVASVIEGTRAGWVRVSPHFYISPEDIERLIAALP